MNPELCWYKSENQVELGVERRGRLVRIVSERLTSPSHDIRHVILTWRYAQQLVKEVTIDDHSPINTEALFAAVCTHDLGRVDTGLSGVASARRSVEIAIPILEEVGYESTAIDLIKQLIMEHDQPSIGHKYCEGTILAEADFLAGLGAWGIWRSLLHSGEKRYPFEKTIEMFTKKLPARIESLLFEYSRREAWRQWPMTCLFLSWLKEQYRSQEVESYPGVYIVFEGLSGSGKGTQIEMLVDTLTAAGVSYMLVNEPSDKLRRTLVEWKEQGTLTSRQRALLHAADREGVVGSIIDGLRRGIVVISDRSLLTSLAYQGEGDDLQMAEVMMMNRNVPMPDLIVYLDISPEDAIRRVNARVNQGKTVRGDFEELDKMRRTHRYYQEAIKHLPPCVQVLFFDAELPQDQIQQLIGRPVTTLLRSKSIELSG